jgi:CRISPR-associated protein Cmr2
MRYTAITFAPIQPFIEKSRKLRDLYGSSFILSFLAKSICQQAGEDKVVIPALIKITQGTPNNIYIYGEVDEHKLEAAFHTAWKTLVDTCRLYIQKKCGDSLFPANLAKDRTWEREWDLWGNQAWELFIVSGASLEEVRRKMATRKQARHWIGINWRGESSTISGTDAIAYPGMATFNPTHSMAAADSAIEEFGKVLARIEAEDESEAKAIPRPQQKMPSAFTEVREKLSIPDLIKRLVTYRQIADQLHDHPNLPKIDPLQAFTKLERKESNLWTGWFQGDGDRIGVYIDEHLVKELSTNEAKNAALKKFSKDMMQWGEKLPTIATDRLQKSGIKARIIYAGGDDFMGVLHSTEQSPKPHTAKECLQEWWYHFNDIWNTCGSDISVSTGFVWAAPNIPQRDLLQHLRDTEKAAKKAGRDRLAIRILFNSGNHLEWSCPWRFLQDLFNSYRDREGDQNWTHIYQDVALLESRHAFSDRDTTIAKALMDLYFTDFKISAADLWNPDPESLKNPYKRLEGGLLGSRPQETADQQQAAECHRYNQWVVNLAKVGFQLSVQNS